MGLQNQGGANRGKGQTMGAGSGSGDQSYMPNIYDGGIRPPPGDPNMMHQ